MTNKEHIEKILYELKPSIKMKYEPLGFNFNKVKDIVLESTLSIENYNINLGVSHYVYYMIEIDKIMNYYFSRLFKLDTEEGQELELKLIEQYMYVANYTASFKKINIDNNMKQNLISKALYNYDGKSILSLEIAKEITNAGKSKTLSTK
jgi:hypothetical protein